MSKHKYQIGETWADVAGDLNDVLDFHKECVVLWEHGAAQPFAVPHHAAHQCLKVKTHEADGTPVTSPDEDTPTEALKHLLKRVDNAQADLGLAEAAVREVKTDLEEIYKGVHAMMKGDER